MHYDPSNITFGIMEPLDVQPRQVDAGQSRGTARSPRSKLARKLAISERALADLDRWRDGLRDGPKAVLCTNVVERSLQTVPGPVETGRDPLETVTGQ